MSAEVLILRDSADGCSAVYVPEAFSRPRIRVAGNLMEVKAQLLRAVERMEATFSAVPRCVVITSRAHETAIKTELVRWLNERPALHGVEVLIMAELSMAARIWSALGSFFRLFARVV